MCTCACVFEPSVHVEMRKRCVYMHPHGCLCLLWYERLERRGGAKVLIINLETVWNDKGTGRHREKQIHLKWLKKHVYIEFILYKKGAEAQKTETSVNSNDTLGQLGILC